MKSNAFKLMAMLILHRFCSLMWAHRCGVVRYTPRQRNEDGELLRTVT